MATNPPEPQPVTIAGTQEFKMKGMPTLIQTVLTLIGLALFIIGGVVGAERFVMTKSLDAMEARMNERTAKSEYLLRQTISEAVAPLNEDQARTRGIVRRLLSTSTLSDTEKKDLTYNLNLGDVKATLHQAPKNQKRRSVESLLANKQIERRETATFKWNEGKNDGQVRYFELLDTTLDLSNTDLYSEGDNDPCDSRVFPLPGVDAVVVEACQSHLDSQGRLEFIVVRNAE